MRRRNQTLHFGWRSEDFNGQIPGAPRPAALKEFRFKNGTIWALNERNAIRKALAAGIKE